MCRLINKGNVTRTKNNKFVQFSYFWNQNNSQYIKKVASNRVCDYGNVKYNNTIILHQLKVTLKFPTERANHKTNTPLVSVLTLAICMTLKPTTQKGSQ